MSLAPAPQLAACLRVLYLGSIRARAIGWDGHENGLSSRQADQIAAVMEAVHNLPYLVANWEECDDAAQEDAVRPRHAVERRSAPSLRR